MVFSNKVQAACKRGFIGPTYGCCVVAKRPFLCVFECAGCFLNRLRALKAACTFLNLYFQAAA
ncbi:hypothetical protein HMPREF9098_0215 [Kingella denitrificans ATCC 33394]|uniref:Uncharacterized protein n=1 Tax=Kingella denitrificans ATCC 33394 TaxID=888741 RepID=F0EWI1_9NEIS|nr:hypothetical protein HMPREF9098_0215 [Kingella denitrificans ATCC 33394]